MLATSSVISGENPNKRLKNLNEESSNLGLPNDVLNPNDEQSIIDQPGAAD